MPTSTERKLECENEFDECSVYVKIETFLLLLNNQQENNEQKGSGRIYKNVLITNNR